MLKDKNTQLSIYSILYSRIPENHILKLINNAVDFSFINTLLEKSYCKYYGRLFSAIEKCSILQCFFVAPLLTVM